MVAHGPSHPDCPVKGHRQLLNSLAFSPDGRLLFSGSQDTSVRVWDVASGELLGERMMGSVVYSVNVGRDWVRDEKCLAATMGAHPRLGYSSMLSLLDADVLRLVIDRV
ncbi:hypothetical protein T484DRAFT_1893850 [Baffinella frigidus]|nr:hypothetical protein T484DRAFT_1893850 [Cryptophyta sp. CCMP2293]